MFGWMLEVVGCWMYGWMLYIWLDGGRWLDLWLDVVGFLTRCFMFGWMFYIWLDIGIGWMVDVWLDVDFWMDVCLDAGCGWIFGWMFDVVDVWLDVFGWMFDVVGC